MSNENITPNQIFQFVKESITRIANDIIKSGVEKDETKALGLAFIKFYKEREKITDWFIPINPIKITKINE